MNRCRGSLLCFLPNKKFFEVLRYENSNKKHVEDNMTMITINLAITSRLLNETGNLLLYQTKVLESYLNLGYHYRDFVYF